MTSRVLLDYIRFLESPLLRIMASLEAFESISSFCRCIESLITFEAWGEMKFEFTCSFSVEKS